MLTVLVRFAFNGIDDLRPLVRNFSKAEMRPLHEDLPAFIERIKQLRS